MSIEVANPYESPREASDGGPSLGGVVTPMFVAAVIFIGVLLLGTVFSRGSFLKIYEDFDTELPNATIIAMSLWSPIAVGLLLLATIAKQFAVQHRSLVRLWNSIACMLAIVLGFCYVMAVFVPLIGGIRSLG